MSLPDKIHANLLEGLSTNFHFDLEGEGGGQFTLSVEYGKMVAREGFYGEAVCTVSAKEEDFKKILKGEINPMLAILTGKLKISNQKEMLKFAKLLGWM